MFIFYLWIFFQVFLLLLPFVNFYSPATSTLLFCQFSISPSLKYECVHEFWPSLLQSVSSIKAMWLRNPQQQFRMTNSIPTVVKMKQQARPQQKHQKPQVGIQQQTIFFKKKKKNQWIEEKVIFSPGKSSTTLCTDCSRAWGRSGLSNRKNKSTKPQGDIYEFEVQMRHTINRACFWTQVVCPNVKSVRVSGDIWAAFILLLHKYTE